MRSVLTFSIVLIFFVVPSSAKTRFSQAKSQAILKREIDYIIKRSNTPRTIKAVDIYSRKDRKRIYEFNSGFLLNPASNLKIVTTSFALQNLGADYKFRTKFFTNGVRGADTVEGDLVVATCGDPLITHSDLDSIAEAISREGIGRIDGNVIIDVSEFDTVEWGSGWMWDDEPSEYQMFISPACLDHNTIDAHVSLDPNSHKLSISTLPVTEFVHIVSTAVADTVDSLCVTRVMRNDTNIITASGRYSPHFPASDYTFSIRHPSQYFGTVFKEMLEEHGVRVHGNVIKESGQVRMKPAGTTDTLFTLEHSIDTVITYINKVSDNLGAECLLRIVPREIYGQIGSAANGIKLERNFLTHCGIDSTQYYIVDGCGLSRYDLITPDAIVKVLNHDLDQPFGDLFLHSLPTSGIDGTLEKRMDQGFLIGNVIAKTGSINGVSTLSGYVLLPKDTLVFSMFMQNFISSGDSIRAIQDSLCKILSLYVDNPTIFKRNLRIHNVGTYWAMHQRKELDRIKRKQRRLKELHRKLSLEH